MPQPVTTLRAANPTLEEGRVFARYLDQAAEGFFGFMLGRCTVDIIAAAFVRPDHDLSHQYVTFAEKDGAIVGMVSCYSGEQHRRSTDLPLRQAAGRYHLRMMAVSILFAPLLRILDTVADNEFYLQAIAVDTGLRGEGIGSALMDIAEASARDSGFSKLCLDVSAGNMGAVKLYERRGMTVVSQWPKRWSIPGFRFLRMTKVL